MNSEIGQLLRDSRNAQHYTLEQVYETTRINPRYIEAMEAGRFTDLPSSTHIRGFLRNYASFLQLDSDELLAQYAEGEQSSAKKWKKRKDPIPPSSPEPSTFYESQGLEILPPRKIAPTGESLLRWVLGLAILGAIGIVGYGLLSDDDRGSIPFLDAIPLLREEASTADDVDKEQIVEALEAETADDLTEFEGSEIIETTNNILSLDNDDASSANEQVADIDNLSLDALGVSKRQIAVEIEILSDRSILIIESDGENVFQQQVTKEDSPLNFDAVQTLTLKSGNAGAVRLRINDQLVGVLGEAKQPFEYTWSTGNPAPPIEEAIDVIEDTELLEEENPEGNNNE